ncbi:pyridoxal-5'-phosphate-dependent protein [Cupriavidus sp. SK-4]|uniref:threonine ammonia-lyase n=1 Tax=Cupriavidus sp. SK-4 TaxID=574750 RepID=UPI00044CA2BB|nr:threonine/serine dehydratase [Cupriavidus sp. SK-4]EYS94039.1 pyridoxal-5'-phosphate-dependent protein [Cupriavidus sp. SK-4]
MSEFDIAAIRQAASRLQGRVVRTPLLESPMLSERAGCRLFVKAEALQLTGSFKIRGALNKMLSMDEASRNTGIVAFSAGNHGQGVAAAALTVGCPAVIVMPNTAPRIKVNNCRWWGAEVVTYDPQTEDRVEVADRVARLRGMTVVPPFDDYDIMAGQGTCGLEIVEQLNDLHVTPDTIIINCSGGGLASGVAEAVKDAFPDTTILIAEVLGYEKVARSLATGIPQSNPSVPKTVLDGIAGPTAGEKTVAVLRRHQAKGIGVSDSEGLAGVAAAFKMLKIVVEPGGAAALGTVLAGKVDVAGKNVVVIASGGNVDPAVFSSALERS